ncbi:MAG: hypothetical protein H5T76_21640 [Streptomyces sp.]|nr:hypothetical protein [Streptomyces sp.]
MCSSQYPAGPGRPRRERAARGDGQSVHDRRVVGVGIAALLIIANFLSIPYYPVWSLTLIALYGFVIWALCVVRREP